MPVIFLSLRRPAPHSACRARRALTAAAGQATEGHGRRAAGRASAPGPPCHPLELMSAGDKVLPPIFFPRITLTYIS